MADEAEGPVLGWAEPGVVLLEGCGPADVDTALSVTGVECGRAECPSGCFDIAILVVSGGTMVSFRYGTDIARRFATDIIAKCDEQDGRAAARNGKLN